jgi:hypothetical protein
MRSIEIATLKVTSPTGKTLWLKKHKLFNTTDIQREIFWKFCKDPMVRFIGQMEATIEEMKILLEISKL